MKTYKCPKCGKLSYSASPFKENEPCIYCENPTVKLLDEPKTPSALQNNLIFVCSPFRGDVEHNTEQAIKYCRQISELGKIPIAPHLYFPQFLNDADPIERTRGISFGIFLMLFCDEVWVFGDVISEGMKHEIEYANSQGKVVKYHGTGCDL